MVLRKAGQKEENEITKFNENSDCYLEPIIPKYNELFTYKITVIFINGEIVNISKIISIIDKNQFNYPTDDKYIFTDKYKCYQYSKDGSVCACPLFVQGDSNLRNLICWDTYIFLDELKWLDDVKSNKYSLNSSSIKSPSSPKYLA